MKKILGKLFGGKEEASAEYKQKQRSPRVRIPLFEGAMFVSHDGKVFPLRNLSESGLALVCNGDTFPGETWGEIRVGGERVAMKMVTVRRNGDEIGAAFTDGQAGIRALLRRVFSDEFKALEMTEVDSSRQKAVEAGNPKWYYAPGNFELFYVDLDGKLVRFEIEWGGNLLALADDGTLRFGVVDQDAVRESASHARSQLVKWAAEVKPEQKLKALRLIENVPGLDGGIRGQMQRVLKS